MTNEVHHVLQRLAELQSTGSFEVPSGVFPSFRLSFLSLLKRKDDNIFFTALILFTLSAHRSVMTVEEKNLYDSIREKALAAFSLYTSSPEGLRLYNFWQKKANAHFPGGNVLHRFKYFKLPDDIDDTALVWLVGGYTTDEIVALKNKVKEHAAYSKRIPYHVPVAYKGLKLYSSWFGKNMPIEVDACVVSNLLYLFLESKQDLNEWDEDNLSFLRKVIHSGDYLHHPFRISPNYAHPVIIYYHLVRLVARFPASFSSEKAALYRHFEVLKALTLPSMLQFALASSALRLEIPSKNIPLTGKTCTKNIWFRAGMMSTWENPLSHRLAPLPLFHLTFDCEAFALALKAEYFLLQRHERAAH